MSTITLAAHAHSTRSLRPAQSWAMMDGLRWPTTKRLAMPHN